MWLNEAFTRLTGYTLDHAGTTWESLLPEDAGASVLELLDTHRPQDPPVQMSVPIINTAGEELTVPVAITPQYDDDGVVGGFVAAQRQSAHVTTSVRETSAAANTPLLVEHQSRRSLELVAKVSELLAEIDEDQLLVAIARLVARRLGVWCAFMVDDGVLHIVEGLTGNVRSRSRRSHTSADALDPVAQLLNGSISGPIEVDLDAHHVPGAPSAQIIDLVNQQIPGRDGRIPAKVLSLPGRGQPLGVMVVLPTAESDTESADLSTVLELVARRVGMVMDNAQLHRSEHVLAETLQRAMLPELDEIAGLDVWTYYAPSSEHAQVGGDWYDVVRLDEEVVAVVIGDVAGHDIEAAAAMGQLRSVVRAFAAEVPDPGDVLSRVDRIVDSMRIARVASLIYATLTQEPERPGRWVLRYTRAGHLPGELVRDGQVIQLAGAGGRLVGFGEAERETAEVEVQPGDVLVLYTDGLVERREQPAQEGVASLRRLLAAGAGHDAASVGETLLRQLGEAPEDDVAVVVVRVPEHDEPTAVGGRHRRWRFPATTESVRSARRAVVKTCRRWGVPDLFSAELVVSELVANAVLHGWGVVNLTLADTGDGLRVEVEDANPMPPVALDTHPARVGGYGMHIVTRLAEWGWRPSGAGKVVWARLGRDSAPEVAS
ncbi:MAG TPA: SpoIIE family protein phosphatase [Beutenbergiaceae bacterium]|nr:SpoIIE family protein phosphatase [Beutenbergiaceae bacterium]